MDSMTAVIDYLERDILRNIVHLKYLDSYRPHVTAHSEHNGEEMGVLLRFPTQVIPFDAAAYPQSDEVVLISADSLAIAQQLARHIPLEKTLVFKLAHPHPREAVLAVCQPRPTRAYRSYTHGDPIAAPDPAIATQSGFDERLWPFYHDNGYSREELGEIFEHHDGQSFTLFEGGQPVCTCFAYRNYKSVWEIGGLNTAPEHRRKGLARRVVASALYALQQQGLQARYSVLENNLPSRALAESLGMRCFMTAEHFLWEPAKFQ